MNIVTLVSAFAENLLTLQEKFSRENRFDLLEKEAVELGNSTIAAFLSLTLTEMDEMIRISGIRKRSYTIQRKTTRTLITTAGDVVFSHTMFQKQADGSYHFLLDELIGLPAHERLSEQAEAEVLREASAGSYQKAADRLQVREQKISKVAVMGKVHGILDFFTEEKALPEEEKKQCKYLYIEADEDHIHQQRSTGDTGGFLGKLIYLYEGKEESCKGRKKLLMPFYQGGLYKGSDGNRELWEKVQRYIEGHYSSDTLKKVYISGDGASWIRAGADYVDRSVLVADRFHVMKYINSVANLTLDSAEETKGRFYKYIYKNKLTAAKKLLTRIKNHCGGDEKVEKCRSYLINNWKAIQRAYHDKNVTGCSAEGHVSHIYSERMSSRPMGWSATGSDAMCHLRCYTKNYGEDKVIDLVRYRRQMAMEELPATGTDGMAEPEEIKKRMSKARRETGAYWERMQASLGGYTIRKTLAIRERLSGL